MSDLTGLEEIERLAPGNFPVTVDFDWRDPADLSAWRPEWPLVAEFCDRKRAQAQTEGAASRYEVASIVLRNEFYVRPNTAGVVVSRATDCMENKMAGRDAFHAEVNSCIWEAMHWVFRAEKLCLDPKYQEKD